MYTTQTCQIGEIQTMESKVKKVWLVGVPLTKHQWILDFFMLPFNQMIGLNADGTPIVIVPHITGDSQLSVERRYVTLQRH